MPDHFVVVRTDIGSELGQHIRDKYQAKVVPTFLILDHVGEIALQQNGQVPKLSEILSLDL